MKRILAIMCAAALMMTVLALAGCSNNNAKKATEASSAAASSAADDKAAATVAATEEDAGFTEIPIFEDEEVGFMNVSAVYFQPVDMSAGATIEAQKAEDFDCHLEADISALENKLGYEKGSWVPYLTVDYKVEDKDGKTAAEGTFMEMAASDGPHYGANIKLPNAGDYKLTITIHSPAENDYLIHTDKLTGPGGTLEEYFPDGKLSVTKSWSYLGPQKV
ncbi:iron transporter [uncultured Ruminococcus sp.]|uniref:iron transporter n=1 Tax=uncultured Ruminococcus sp. TaxID=165186 RepID=UPI00292FF93B|nr:iron transporter [uncultured Ruminococcus sp.]